MLLSGLVIGGASLLAGSRGSGLGLLVFFLVAALLVSPRAFPRSLTDEAARVASDDDGRPIVYWRPGCP
jgi:mycoredoxin